MEHVRSARFRKSELIWLAGNTFYGQRGIFEPAFLAWLERDFRLSDYELLVEDLAEIPFFLQRSLTETTMWEIYALSIIDELKTESRLKEAQRVRSRHSVCEGEDEAVGQDRTALRRTRSSRGRLRDPSAPQLPVAGIRGRRYGNESGCRFYRNVHRLSAHKHDLEAIGTNAHEIPMVLAALAPDDKALKASQYRVLEIWQSTYEGALRIMLPDTFGTTQFLQDAPDWVADWTGQRMDSKNPYVAGDEYIEWLAKRGREPHDKLIIASDALDVDQILSLHAHFGGVPGRGMTPKDFHGAGDFLDQRKWSPDRRIRFSAGWGTLLTNDFRGCDPAGGSGFDPISLICKVCDVEGRPAVKLSDNYAKALGPPAEIERYRRVFGTAGVANAPLVT